MDVQISNSCFNGSLLRDQLLMKRRERESFEQERTRDENRVAEMAINLLRYQSCKVKYEDNSPHHRLKPMPIRVS